MKIQQANVDDVDVKNMTNFFEGKKGWKTLIEYDNSKILLDAFLGMLNDDRVDTENNWFRVIK